MISTDKESTVVEAPTVTAPDVVITTPKVEVLPKASRIENTEALQGTVISSEPVAGGSARLLTLEIAQTRKTPMPQVPYVIAMHSSVHQGVMRPYTPIITTNTLLMFLIRIYPQIPDKKMLTPEIGSFQQGNRVLINWAVHKTPMPMLFSVHTVIFISAGTGISAMLQLMDRIWNRPSPNELKITRVISISYNSDMPVLCDRITRMYAGNLIEHNILTRNTTKTTPPEIERTLLEISQTHGLDITQTPVLVCGPSGFIERVAGKRRCPVGGVLGSLGVPNEYCYKY